MIDCILINNMVTSVLIQNIYIRIGRYVYIYILPNTQDEVSLTRLYGWPRPEDNESI